jgi:GT2 family glycosyltransferase
VDGSNRGERVAVPRERRSEGVIGVVIIGRNESARLEECLGSLTAYGARVVYADSASTDGSADIAREWGALVVDVDPATTLTPARGRNEGFIALLEHVPDCEFVQFVDGDSVVQPGWIEAGSDFLRTHDKAAVVCGRVEEAHPEQSVYNWLCADEWKGPLGRIHACGGNAMIRATAFHQVGGFRSDLAAGEEAHLMSRLRDHGWEIWRIDKLMVVHDARLLTFAEWWRRTERGGHSYANMWCITKDWVKPLYLTQLRSCMFWVLVLPGTVTACAAALSTPSVMIVIPVAYLLQITRLAVRRGAASASSWVYSLMIMLAKVPEAAGVLSYIYKRFFKPLDGRPPSEAA